MVNVIFIKSFPHRDEHYLPGDAARISDTLARFLFSEKVIRLVDRNQYHKLQINKGVTNV